MKNLLLASCLACFGLVSFAQSNELPVDQPDWVEMMKDGDYTFEEIVAMHNEYWEGKEITPGCGWKPFKRWESLMSSRQRDGYAPRGEDMVRLYQDVKAFTSSRSMSGNWLPLGPILDDVTTRENINGVGRTSALAFHPTDPNTIFIGCPAGGVWRTYDGGDSWVSNTDDLPTLGVSAIAFDPQNPQVVYIGTGDRDANDSPGMGVMKSTDGGLSWDFANAGIENLVIGEIIVHPEDGNLILVASNDGMWRSADAGNSWTFVGLNSSDYRDMKLKPDDPNTVYSTGSGKFYRSEDFGLTWDWVNDGLQSTARMVIGVTAAAPNIVYVCGATTYEFHKFYKSTDAGLNFEVMSTGPNILGWAADGSSSGGQAWYDFCMAGDPLDSNKVIVGGIRMKQSNDGGQTWIDINPGYLHVDQHECDFSPHNNDLYLANDGGFYHYEENSSWKDISTGIVNGQIYKLGQSPHNGAKALTGFQDNGTSEFSGSQWQRVNGGDGFECWYDHEDPTWWYTSLYYGQIYRTGGEFQNEKICGENFNNINEAGAWITPFFQSYWDDNRMFVGLKNVWRCDSIKHPIQDSLVWHKLSNNLGGNNSANLIDLVPSKANQNILYATEGLRKIFRTDSANTNNPEWVDVWAGLPFVNVPITAVETHPTDENVVYCAFNNTVWRSGDKGETWEDIGGDLPEVQTNSIVYDINTDEGLYLGTDMGIYYKDNSMSDWIPFSDGMPLSVRVTELEIYYGESLADSRIRAATYGRGLWESDLFDSETYNFPATAFFVQNTYDDEVFDDFELNIQFYKNLQTVGVSGFTIDDIYIENGTANLVEESDDLYTLGIEVDAFGPIFIYVENQAATDAFGIATFHSDTLTIVYNPEPEPFGPFGPGGVGDDSTLPIWLRADKGAASNGAEAQNGEPVDFWDNQGSGPDAEQFVDDEAPVMLMAGEGINNMPVVFFDGDNDFLEAEGVTTGQNISVFSVVEGNNIAFNTHGWIASARQPNGFVLHPWKDESRFSAMIIDNEEDYANGPIYYIGDAAAPHIYGVIYEQNDYFQIFNTLFDQERYEFNGADIGVRDGSAQIDIRYGWDYDDRFGEGKLGEHFIYNRRLHQSQWVIVSNYLGVKFGIDLGLVKKYEHWNKPFDVAGIGRESQFDYHLDAQGTGIVRMSDPSAISNDEYLLWGHDGEPYVWEENGYPIYSQRLETTWGYEQTGDVGEVLVRIVASEIPNPGTDIGLIVGDADEFLPSQSLQYFPLTLEGDYYTTTAEFPASGVFTIGVEPAVGVEDLAKADIKVYPNPSSDNFRIDVYNTTLSNFNYMLLDQMGRVVLEGRFNGSTLVLNATSLASGTYQLKLINGDQSTVRTVVKI